MQTEGNINKSIGCTVTQCRYHDKKDYCTLEHIHVITNSDTTNMESTEVTDCGSYEKNDVQ